MLSYLTPKDGPVIKGLEHKEVVYAKHQPEYIPLRTLVTDDLERRVISRWTLTPEQREAVAKGCDIFLELLTFGKPLQPIRLFLNDGAGDECAASLGFFEEQLVDAAVAKVKV